MRILVTGHTGFKGSWLALMLASRGHEVTGLALDPPAGGLYEKARVAELLADDIRLDIREADATRIAIESTGADLVFHLAAQPLVRRSYGDPRETYETNVNGTLNVLEGIKATPQTKASVIITTDKVYRNVGQKAGYVETDALGGFDPYSSSKAMADIMTQSWMQSFPGTPMAIARAGNVIGGGDVSQDRLLVDIINGFISGDSVHIRMPDAVRPWEHVLDCLSGYLAIADNLLAGGADDAWNISPDPDSFQTVREIADTATKWWGGKAGWVDDSGGQHPHEASLLILDPSKIKRELGWRNLLQFPANLEWTLDWERETRERAADPRAVALAQIAQYVNLMPDAKWWSRF